MSILNSAEILKLSKVVGFSLGVIIVLEHFNRGPNVVSVLFHGLIVCFITAIGCFLVLHTYFLLERKFKKLRSISSLVVVIIILLAFYVAHLIPPLGLG